MVHTLLCMDSVEVVLAMHNCDIITMALFQAMIQQLYNKDRSCLIVCTVFT